MPKLSIIISAYNSGEWIKNRLDNLYMSEAIGQAEVIVVNANSPDELDHTVPQSYPVQYHKLDERVGLYTAWNIAINNSSGEYITNANTDDIVSPKLYNKLFALLDGGLIIQVGM
jgi:glycosyltransferase involved in cell wall biosynthesis